MRSNFILLIFLLLGLISCVTLYSITPSLAQTQFVFFLLGITIFWVTSHVPAQFFLRWKWYLYLGLIFALVLTLFIGDNTRGSSRWIEVGGFFKVQSSQLAVPLAGLMSAYFLAKIDRNKFRSLWRYFLTMGIVALLILIEPDLGTTLIYSFSLGSALIIANLPLKYYLSLFFSLIMIIVIGSFFLKPYQRQRATDFLAGHESGQNYNAYQSLIAVGSGQLFGRGLGQGVQSQLRFLPEKQTDFVFASFSEEWGFLGSLLIVAIYFSLISFLMYQSYTHENLVYKYFLFTSSIYIFGQSLINIGMNMSLFPITGITLPLVSYGGSSFLSFALLLGMCQNMISSKKNTILPFIT